MITAAFKAAAVTAKQLKKIGLIQGQLLRNLQNGESHPAKIYLKAENTLKLLLLRWVAPLQGQVILLEQPLPICFIKVKGLTWQKARRLIFYY